MNLNSELAASQDQTTKSVWNIQYTPEEQHFNGIPGQNIIASTRFNLHKLQSWKESKQEHLFLLGREEDELNLR